MYGISTLLYSHWTPNGCNPIMNTVKICAQFALSRVNDCILIHLCTYLSKCNYITMHLYNYYLYTATCFTFCSMTLNMIIFMILDLL